MPTMRICILIIDNCLKFLGCSQRILIRDGSRNFSSRFLGRDETRNAVSSRLVPENQVSTLSRIKNFGAIRSLDLSRFVSIGYPKSRFVSNCIRLVSISSRLVSFVSRPIWVELQILNLLVFGPKLIQKVETDQNWPKIAIQALIKPHYRSTNLSLGSFLGETRREFSSRPVSSREFEKILSLVLSRQIFTSLEICLDWEIFGTGSLDLSRCTSFLSRYQSRILSRLVSSRQKPVSTHT